MRINTLLFDLDGTLIDSEFFHFECWNEILKQWSVELSYDTWLKQYAGIPTPKTASILHQKYALPINLSHLIQIRETMTAERLKTKEIGLMPYVSEVIPFFFNKDITLAVVTSSSRSTVETIIKKNGLGNYFKLIVTRSEVSKSKPDPESYNICCEKLGIDKEQCIVFEDTVNGVKAAKAAGLICYAIQGNFSEHHQLTAADKIFTDLKAAKNYLIERNMI